MRAHHERERHCAACSYCLCEQCQQDVAEWIALPLRARVRVLVREGLFIDALYEVGLPEWVARLLGRLWFAVTERDRRR